MEAYEGNTLESIHKSMAILAEFPKQVVVLKDTRTVCGLRLGARGSGLQSQLIDERQTREFSCYCGQLIAKQGDELLQKHLLGKNRGSNLV